MASSVYYLPTAKNSWENFCGKLKNRESLAQRIFSRLRYMYNYVCSNACIYIHIALLDLKKKDT